MQNYPIFINIQNQPCLVIGAGDIAVRKIRLQLSAGAKVTVIAPSFSQSFSEELLGKVNYQQREFEDRDVDGFRLITAATNNSTVNERVSQLANQKNVPVNVVDQPHLCSFITPSIIDRGAMTIAVSTGGGAPVLARNLRGKLEAFIPENYRYLVKAMHDYRELVKSKLPNEDERRRFWDRVIQGEIAELYLSGRTKKAEQALKQALSSEEFLQKDTIGEVWLIGAGPGDPDLLTFKALRLMQQCDVVLHDALVSEEILNLCRRDADRIYVGKRRANHAVPQEGINQLLVDLAKQGKRVVRLKGGDPFIFGRGGEEIQELFDAKISFQVVPGITSASGCATYAGIPLTHRDYAQSVTFVAGHLKGGYANLDWPHLANPNQTLVIYMGLIGLPFICEKLVEYGLSEETPIAIIEKGTRPEQRVITATLTSISSKINSEKIQAPTLIIVGNVVTLRDKLTWM